MNTKTERRPDLADQIADALAHLGPVETVAECGRWLDELTALELIALARELGDEP